ncbi:ISAs1 family transposase [Bradyrhizobium sp. BWA-3-5]|uniref:ISAs1 family transposase n=1 Tax=Bradyrhizobium sp. BWA-3-5 TaxID=3080013 RepID=UPI00397E3BBF
MDGWPANAGTPAKHKVRYFLASRRLSAKKLLAVVRTHWGIENNLHWVLDTVFDEDACRSRKDHTPENLALAASSPSTSAGQHQDLPASDGDCRLKGVERLWGEFVIPGFVKMSVVNIPATKTAAELILSRRSR